MNAHINTNKIAKVDSGTAVDTLSRISITTMGAASGFIGLWAATCFMVALVSNGPLGLIRSYITAVTGL